MTTATTDQVTNDQAAPAVRILKIATCPSMSGKSKLTYHIGCTAESDVLTEPQLCLRVYANSAAGFFSKEWVTLSSIQKLFAKASDPKAITSFVLRQIFHGKSINTPGFLFAVLFNEGLVKPSTTTKRCYECCEAKKFFAEMKALAASKVDLTDKLAKKAARPQKIVATAVKGKQQPAVADTKKAVGTGQAINSKAKPPASTKSVAPASKKAATKVSPKAS